MDSRELGDDFGMYPPYVSSSRSQENSGNNGPSRPQHHPGSLPPPPNNLTRLENPANGYSSSESILGRDALPENRVDSSTSLFSCLGYDFWDDDLGYGVWEDDLGEYDVLEDHQGLNNPNIYWGDRIEAIHSSHHRNQEQQWPVSLDLETAMSRLNLSNTAQRSSVNAVGHGGLNSSFDARRFESGLSEPKSYCTGLPSNTGPEDFGSEGFGHSAYTHYPSGNLQSGDRRFSAAVNQHQALQFELVQHQRELQRSLLRERHARNSNNLLHPSCYHNNARFQQRRLRLDYNYTPFDELRGLIYLTAKDECGYSFLENMLLDGNPDDIEIIFWEIKDHLCELMVHQFAHHVVDTLMEVCNQSQMTRILRLVVSDEHTFIALCNDMLGTHGVQNLLEHLTTKEQISMAVSALRCGIHILIKNNNGHHVIMHCLKLFTAEDNKPLLNEAAINCLEIARDKHGCCVLQKCVLHAKGELREFLLEEITSNCLILSKDPYGNYVVQYVLEQKIPHITEEIIRRLTGSFVSMSLDKFGSHVVEKCLKKSKNEQVEHIVNEIMHSKDFLTVVQSPYGNFVMQSALTTSKGRIFNSLVIRIQDEYLFLHSHPFGKKVLLKAR